MIRYEIRQHLGKWITQGLIINLISVVSVCKAIYLAYKSQVEWYYTNVM